MRKLVAITLVIAVVSLTVPRALCASGTITLDEAVRAALDANPEVKAAGFEAEAARARPPQAASPPDPKFMVDFIGVPTNTADVTQGTIQYMGEQEIPFPSKLVYGYKAEKRAAEAAASHKATTELELVRQVKRAYLELWRLSEEARIEREAFSVLRQNKGSAGESYATLKAPVADPVRASVELGDIEGKLAIIEQDRLASIAELSRLMASPLDPSVRVAEPPAAPPIAAVDALIARARESRPEVGEAQSLIQSQQAKLSLAKSQYTPDLTLRLGYMDNPTGLPNAWYGRAGITVPLWALSKQRFGVRESRAMLERAQSVKDAALLTAESDVKIAHARLMAAQKTARIYGSTVLPRARMLLGSSREAYAAGSGDFLGIVDAVRSLSNAQLMHVRARVDALLAVADLERAVGVPLTGEDR